MSNDNETPEHDKARRNSESGKTALQTRADLAQSFLASGRKMVKPVEPKK